jgi:hypothetical protein
MIRLDGAAPETFVLSSGAAPPKLTEYLGCLIQLEGRRRRARVQAPRSAPPPLLGCPDFAAWARKHDKELRTAEQRWGIRAGRDMSNPDMGHWEWGGGEGNRAPDRGKSFGPLRLFHRGDRVVGDHPATNRVREDPDR